MTSLWYLYASQCRAQNMRELVASGIKMNYWTNLGKRREHEWFKNKFQGSKLLQVEGSSPSLPLLGQKVMDVFPLLPLSTYGLWYGRTLTRPQRAGKRKQPNPKWHEESLTTSEPVTVCASGLQMLWVKDVYLWTFFWGGGWSVQEFVATE